MPSEVIGLAPEELPRENTGLAQGGLSSGVTVLAEQVEQIVGQLNKEIVNFSLSVTNILMVCKPCIINLSGMELSFEILWHKKQNFIYFFSFERNWAVACCLLQKKVVGYPGLQSSRVQILYVYWSFEINNGTTNSTMLEKYSWENSWLN